MLNTRDLTPHLGVEVADLDLTRGLSPSNASALLRTLDKRGVVVLRRQNLTLDQFMAISRSLGPPYLQPQQHSARPEHPGLTLLTNIVENGQPIGNADSGRQWQSDGAHLKTPVRATIFYAVEIPEKDGTPLGDTLFANTSAAFEALEPNLQTQLRGMRAAHNAGTGRKGSSTPFYMDAGLTQIFKRGMEHPLVRAHPATGGKCLYVNQRYTSRISGMNDRDSAELLAELYRHMERPEFIYRHPWQAGDLVLCDNCSTQHRTQRDYELPARRLLYRTMLKGAAGR